jgi:drug/metabolite transporter (DMT)-like permease
VTPRAWAAFAIVSVAWGVPYYLIKVGVGEVSPALVAWSRLALCAVLLLPLAASRGALRPAWERRWWVAALGLGYMALPFTLIPIGERFISSSLAAIIIGAVPLVVALITLRAERPRPLRIVGLLVGFAGVATLVGVDVGGRREELIGVACLALVAILYAIGPVVTSRRLAEIDPVATVAIASSVGVAALSPVILVSGLPLRVPSKEVIFALLALGVACTAVGLALYFFLVTEAGPTRASVVTYVNPAVAVIVGVALLHERVTAATLAGFALILAGSWLATLGRAQSRVRAAAPQPLQR